MCSSSPFCLYRYTDHEGKDHYLRTLKDGFKQAQTESIYSDTPIMLEQVEVTMGRPLDETIKAVLCDGAPLWMNIRMVALFENGERRKSLETSRESTDSQHNP